jgi:mannose-6-phosphate isomerase class I
MSIRPYLVIPKLIKQPTWGGAYIPEMKGWQHNNSLANMRIGQSYELYHGSNLSLLTSSDDPKFTGEITDATGVSAKTAPPSSIPLGQLITSDPKSILGKGSFEHFGNKMPLLIKFTQALGNSFQLHIKDGTADANWKPKPESWYFFEPGIITLGAHAGVDWKAYQEAVTELNNQILSIGNEVKEGSLEYSSAQIQIKQLVTHFNPWQYVNTLQVKAETLIDLSPCGIHHSWEEDPQKAPLGNVVYELQVDVTDAASTIRNFDKGKMAADGATRQLHIEDYFKFIDRDPQTNDPKTHMTHEQIISNQPDYEHTRLLQTNYYTLERLQFKKAGTYSQMITHFRHLFVKDGAINLTSGTTELMLTRGHSAFVPADCQQYTIASRDKAIVLISF